MAPFCERISASDHSHALSPVARKRDGRIPASLASLFSFLPSAVWTEVPVLEATAVAIMG